MPRMSLFLLWLCLCNSAWALNPARLDNTDVRLPLVGLTDGTKDRIRAAMVHAGIL